MPMQVLNGGSSELTALIMFVVDATKPFSVPATMPVSKTSQSPREADGAPCNLGTCDRKSRYFDGNDQ